MKDNWKQCQYWIYAYMFAMVDSTNSEFIFPRYGPIALREKDEKIESKVSDLWTTQYKVILDLYDSYNSEDDDEFDDSLVGQLNLNLTSYHGKKGANVTMSDSPAAGLKQIFRRCVRIVT